MADERLNKEREYQETLKQTSSIFSGLQKMISDVEETQEGLGEVGKEYLRTLRSVVSEVNTIEDVTDAVSTIDGMRLNIGKQLFGANKKIADLLRDTSNMTASTLQADKQRLIVYNKIGETANNITNSFNRGYQALVDQARQIPIIGAGLGWLGDASAEFVGSLTSRGMRDAVDEISKGFTDGGIRGGMASITSSAGKMGTAIKGALSSGLVLVGLFVIALGVAFKRFSALEEATKSFREETGLLISQTSQLREQVRGVSVDYAEIGATAEMASSAAATFTKEFDNIRQASNETLESMIVLNRNFGVSFGTAAKTAEVFERMAGLTETQSQFLVASTVEMARQAKVAPEQVLADIAENSGVAYRFFGGSVTELQKAAVQAAKLGTSLGDAAKVAENLINFESSITSELTASAMLGTDLNLSRARYLALTKDAIGSQQAVIDQVQRIGNLRELNTFQQDALVEATGMEFEELVKLTDIRQKFGVLDEERLTAAKQYADTQGDIRDLSREELEVLTQRLKEQNEFRSQTEVLSDMMGSMGVALMDAFTPLADFLMPILIDTAKILKGVLLPLFKGIGDIFSILEPPLTFIYNTLVNMFTPIFKIGKAFLEGFLEPLSVIKDVVMDLFSELSSNTNEMEDSDWLEPTLKAARALGEVLGWVALIVGSIISGFGTVAAAIGTVLALGTTLYSLFSDWKSNILEPILDIFSMFSVMMYKIPLVGGFETEVEDAVINPRGDVVSTDPEDWLIATKTPETLIEPASSTAVDMTPILNKLDEVKQAYLSNKDVYMDKEKVSSTVKVQNERSNVNLYGLGVG